MLRARVALAVVLRERLGHDGLERRRHRGIELAQVEVQVLETRLPRQRAAAQALEERDAHGPEVHLHLLLARLGERAHVRGRAGDAAHGGGEGAAAARLDAMRDAEVDELDLVQRAAQALRVGRHHDVLGLDVAVDEARAVHGREAAQQPGDDGDDVGRHRELEVLRLDHALQRRALDALAHDVVHAAGRARGAEA